MKAQADMLKAFLVHVKSKKSEVKEVSIDITSDKIWARTMDPSKVRLVEVEMPFTMSEPSISLNISDIDFVIKTLERFKGQELDMSIDSSTGRIVFKSDKKKFEVGQIDKSAIEHGKELKAILPIQIDVSEEDFEAFIKDMGLIKTPYVTLNHINGEDTLSLTAEADQVQPKLTTTFTVDPALPTFKVAYAKIPEMMECFEGAVHIEFGDKLPLKMTYTTASGIKVTHVIGPWILDL